jgi:hypothetical protein
MDEIKLDKEREINKCLAKYGNTNDTTQFVR